MRENTLRSYYKYIVLAVAVLAACVLLNIKAANVKADPLDYVTGTYSGEVKASTGSVVYTAPGTVNPKLLDVNGNSIRLADGTKLTILSEQLDPDSDMWYEVIFTYENNEYKGFVFSGRTYRDPNSFKEFTPTPAPTEEPTPEPTEEVQEPTDTEEPVATPTEIGDAFNNPDNATDEGTNQMINDSTGFKPWTYVIILIIVIILFFIVYTWWVKRSEEKLEREMERYSNKPQYEPLEGELVEDFEQAKSNYYDHIKLGDQQGKDLGEMIGNPDDIQLDMKALQDEEPDDIDEIINGLEEKYGSELKTEEDWTRGEEEEDWSVNNESVDEWSDEEPAEVFEDEDASWNEEDHEVPEEAVEELEEVNDFEETPVEDLPRIEMPENLVSQNTLDFEASKAAIVANQRAYLDTLPAGVSINHKVYGVGKVVDNSDENIIQVSFGDDMRFLKKDKLVEKNLIRF